MLTQSSRRSTDAAGDDEVAALTPPAVADDGHDALRDKVSHGDDGEHEGRLVRKVQVLPHGRDVRDEVHEHLPKTDNERGLGSLVALSEALAWQEEQTAASRFVTNTSPK